MRRYKGRREETRGEERREDRKEERKGEKRRGEEKRRGKERRREEECGEEWRTWGGLKGYKGGCNRTCPCRISVGNKECCIEVTNVKDVICCAIN